MTTLDIRCYGKNDFDVFTPKPSAYHLTREDLVAHCFRNYIDGNRPDRISVIFVGKDAPNDKTPEREEVMAFIREKIGPLKMQSTAP